MTNDVQCLFEFMPETRDWREQKEIVDVQMMACSVFHIDTLFCVNELLQIEHLSMLVSRLHFTCIIKVYAILESFQKFETRRKREKDINITACSVSLPFLYSMKIFITVSY